MLLALGGYNMSEEPQFATRVATERETSGQDADKLAAWTKFMDRVSKIDPEMVNQIVQPPAKSTYVEGVAPLPWLLPAEGHFDRYDTGSAEVNKGLRKVFELALAGPGADSSELDAAREQLKIGMSQRYHDMSPKNDAIPGKIEQFIKAARESIESSRGHGPGG
jgi:hypothetical protein